MKKVAIITLTDNLNYGNRLQNYALSKKINEYGFETNTLWRKNSIKKIFKNFIKKTLFFCGSVFNNQLKAQRNTFKREKRFKKFTEKFIKCFYYRNLENIDENDFYKFIIGSDQIWSPLALKRYPIALGTFINDKRKIVSYAPSLGVSEVDEEYISKMKNAYSKFPFSNISVRENRGKEILTSIFLQSNIEVLIDPTLLLTTDDWNKIVEKPLWITENKKYILIYFLGKISELRMKEIERIAQENNCEIINVLDKLSNAYCTNPNEFLYLEKNAFLVCTDSFHSCVFAFLYNVPFIIFEREDKMQSMNSRIETFINKFELKNRKFEDKIMVENLIHDYSKGYEILKNERIKSEMFLKQALE